MSVQKPNRIPSGSAVSRKPTNRRAFIAWLTHTLESQGVTVQQPLSYAALREAIEARGIQPADQR